MTGVVGLSSPGWEGAASVAAPGVAPARALLDLDGVSPLACDELLSLGVLMPELALTGADSSTILGRRETVLLVALDPARLVLLCSTPMSAAAASCARQRGQKRELKPSTCGACEPQNAPPQPPQWRLGSRRPKRVWQSMQPGTLSGTWRAASGSDHW